jgi:hypothetical protein
MANKSHDLIGQSRQTPPPLHRGTHEAKLAVKKVGWPGLPGKSQPKNRSGGTKKTGAFNGGGFHVDSEGL